MSRASRHSLCAPLFLLLIWSFLVQYTDVIATYPGQAFYDLGADTGVTCGHIVLATTAAKGYKSPVYLGVNVKSPSNPYGTRGVECTLPFHMWDYFAATRVRGEVVLHWFDLL